MLDKKNDLGCIVWEGDIAEQLLQLDDFSALQSLVTQVQQTLKLETNGDQKEARRLASERIGSGMFHPKLTGEQFEKLLARSRAFHYGDKRNENLRASIAKRKEQKKDEVKVGTISSMYRRWCSENNWVAPDTVLSHFVGASANTFAAARAKLTQEGFSFEKNGHGWNIKPPEVRVEEKKYSEAEVKDLFEKLLTELRK